MTNGEAPERKRKHSSRLKELGLRRGTPGSWCGHAQPVQINWQVVLIPPTRNGNPFGPYEAISGRIKAGQWLKM